MKNSIISNFLRRIGLLYTADSVRYHFMRAKHRKVNNEFLNAFPTIRLPPDYLLYESFQLNYKKYFFDSKSTAQWLADYFKKYTPLIEKKILDWGCGPGRIIRHLPEVIGGNCKYYGTDYNKRSIEWCKANLPGINFNHNNLDASLPYADNTMDIIYGISIFTHLSREMHFDWFRELLRILKPGGIIFITTQGDNFKIKLSASELQQYNKGQLVVRGRVKEGHRTYSAFQPPAFMKMMIQSLQSVNVLEHIETRPSGSGVLPQDIWIFRKRA